MWVIAIYWLVLFILGLIYGEYGSASISLLALIMMPIFIFSFKQFDKYVNAKKFNASIALIIMSTMFVVLLGFFSTISFSIHTGYNTRYSNMRYKEVSFQINDRAIETTDTCKFIGETKNYIFLYDQYSNETLIFERSNIEFLKTSSIEEDDDEVNSEI